MWLTVIAEVKPQWDTSNRSFGVVDYFLLFYFTWITIHNINTIQNKLITVNKWIGTERRILKRPAPIATSTKVTQTKI